MKRSQSPAKGAFLRIFAIPLVLAAVSTVGLLSALLGDHVWDVVSWAALAAHVSAIAWVLTRPRQRER